MTRPSRAVGRIAVSWLDFVDALLIGMKDLEEVRKNIAAMTA